LDALLEAISLAAIRLHGRQGSKLTLSRRETVISSLAAAFALMLVSGCRRPSEPAVQQQPALPPAARERDVVLRINGEAHTLKLEPRVSLLDALRERLGFTGSKKGCDHGQCGACTVLVGGQRMNSCLLLVVMVENVEVTTIEGLARGEELHPMQVAFVSEDGLQCGYCTPSQIISAVALLKENRASSDAEIREQMSGNICRCGAYPQHRPRHFGGVGSKPWRSSEVEQALVGQRAVKEVFERVAPASVASAKTTADNAFKAKLVQRVLVRALARARDVT
jgi:xanthine dehydrogenase YagT iron-sulfur-binding subunit